MTEETGVKETRELVKEGLDGTEKLAKKNDSLNELMQKTSANVEQMEKLTNMIEGFAGVIAGIANKTNMLALNASIEAARAGEYGRGFSVVANEIRGLADQSKTAAEKINITKDDIDWFVPHQANVRIIETAAKKLGVPMDKFIVTLDHYGNTSSASIPLALCEATEKGIIRRGQTIAIIGFGAGLTYGGIIMEY